MLTLKKAFKYEHEYVAQRTAGLFSRYNALNEITVVPYPAKEKTRIDFAKESLRFLINCKFEWLSAEDGVYEKEQTAIIIKVPTSDIENNDAVCLKTYIKKGLILLGYNEKLNILNYTAQSI